MLRPKGHGLIEKRPKTKAGERTLGLPSWAISMLRRRAAEAAGNPERLNKGVNFAECWVFPTELENLRDPSNTRRDLRRAFKRIGYQGLTSHTFRKTTASLMDAAGPSAGLPPINLATRKSAKRRTPATGEKSAGPELRTSWRSSVRVYSCLLIVR